MAVLLPATLDNAQAQLDSGINNSVLTITLGSGEGASFPQPYNGTASSTGSSTTLNDTGDLGDVNVGDFIRNVTDGSWAICTVAGTNSITTTRLQGGTDDTWESGDVWRVGEFVITLDDGDANGENVTKREKVLISDRSTDQLTVPSGGRGFDSSSAQSFDAADYVRLNVTSYTIEQMVDALADVKEMANANQTSIEANDTELDNLRKSEPFWLTSVSGTNTITATGNPTVSAYADGLAFNFSAAGANTGATTLNVDSVGAKKIKKFTGGSEEELSANDIVNNQVVSVVYDSALDSSSGAFVLVSPKGQEITSELESESVTIADGTEVGASSTSEANMDDNFSIGAGTMAARDVFYVKANGHHQLASGSLTIKLKLGSTSLGQVLTSATTGAADDAWSMDAWITVRTTGASGTVIAGGIVAFSNVGEIEALQDNDSGHATTEKTVDTTGALTLQLSAQFSASDAAHGVELHSLIVHKVNAPS